MLPSKRQDAVSTYTDDKPITPRPLLLPLSLAKSKGLVGFETIGRNGWMHGVLTFDPY
jgi:hypothetical protein